MPGRSTWLLVASLATAGCLHDDLVHCGDLICPHDYTCDESTGQAVCADPTGLSLPAARIDFGNVACGAMQMLVVPIHNVGSADLTFNASSTVPNLVSVSPASGTLAPDQELDLQVVAASPATTDLSTGMPLGGDLVIDTNAEHVVRSFSVNPVGAVIATSVSTLDFGENQTLMPNVRSFSIQNTGNELIEVTPVAPTATASEAYSLASTAPIALGPGASQSIPVTFDPPLIQDYLSDQVGLQYQGTTCQVPPSAVALSGAGVDSDAVVLENLVLDFGTVACGVMPATSSVALQSNYGAAYPVGSAISGPDASLFSTTTNSTLPSGSSGPLELPVTRGAVTAPSPVGTRTATLTLSIQDPASTVKTVSLTQNVVAPVLSSKDLNLCFAQPRNTTSPPQPVNVMNMGNAPAVVVAPTTMGLLGGSTISISPSSLSVPANGMGTFNVTFHAGSTLGGGDCIPLVFQAAGECSLPITVILDYLVIN